MVIHKVKDIMVSKATLQSSNVRNWIFQFGQSTGEIWFADVMNMKTYWYNVNHKYLVALTYHLKLKKW